MNELRISNELCLPREAATWVISYLAKRGAGKTYCSSVQAEEMQKAGIPIVVVDGMGIWWGLRVSADGLHAGLPIVVFGGEHADLPLVPEKAAEMAKAVVESNISCVLDLSPFSKYAARKIVSSFLDTLYRLNRVERHVFIEESDLWAPQRPIGPEEALCLSSVDNFVRRGGNHNLGCTLITQRSAVLNKDILTQSDCLVVLRTLAPQDKKAIQAWVEEQTDKDKTEQNKWYDTLKELENGEAWVWHPEKPAIFQKVRYRQRETFHATREFIRSPRASKIVLMGVGEFVERFKKVFETSAEPVGAYAPKLSEDAQRRLKFLSEQLLERDKTIGFLELKEKSYKERLAGAEKALENYENLKCALNTALRIQNIYDNIHKVEEKIPAGLPVAGQLPTGLPNQIDVTETIPEIRHRIDRPVVETNEATREGQLITLACHGFFNEKKRLSEIGKEMNRCYLFSTNHLGRDLPPPLGRLVELKVLQREEMPNGGWVYWLADGAKERIKEVSV
jgi:hypothetical protein